MKTLKDLRWAFLDGAWDKKGEEFCFDGYEYDPPEFVEKSAQTEPQDAIEKRAKFVALGTLLFDQNFQEGRISMQIEFEKVDHRSLAGILIQQDPETKDVLMFSVTGGGLNYLPGVSGSLFKLQYFGSLNNSRQQQQKNSNDRARSWTTLFEIGVGVNLKPNTKYDLAVEVRGALISLFVDNVEIGRHTLAYPSLSGLPCGAFCMSHGKIYYRDISISAVIPKAFVVMQFQTPEYEAMFTEVIQPICRAEGLLPYRADSTYMPGLIIEDIKKQILESRVIIAEITPQNPNVYYEIGYADALNKPVILISDRKEGLKPFDVRAYRTIFYDNSIGGKAQVENDLRAYLRSIMDR